MRPDHFIYGSGNEKEGNKGGFHRGEELLDQGEDNEMEEIKGENEDLHLGLHK